MTVTPTIGLGGGDATTRALSAAGVKTFEVGDQIALKYEQDGSYDMQKAVATAQNISADGKSATFTFTLDNPQSNSDMFPAIACTILFLLQASERRFIFFECCPDIWQARFFGNKFGLSVGLHYLCSQLNPTTMEQRQWKEIRKFEEIRFEEFDGIAKITINRPRYRNAFTPKTTLELSQAFADCRELQRIRVVLLTGQMSQVPEGQRLEDVKHAFCSGGDMHVKGRGGYIDDEGVPRLSVLDVQMQIRRLPKPVIAMVNGYAIGGGHVLHLVCDLTIASENAIFGQTGPKVGSFDAGFGSSYLARIVGQKKAREIWFMCRQYSAREAEQMGMVNRVVPLAELEDECVRWAQQMMMHSPIALRMIKAGLNAELDGQAGIQQLAGDATMLYYFMDEAQEGGRAFLEKRKPRF